MNVQSNTKNPSKHVKNQNGRVENPNKRARHSRSSCATQHVALIGLGNIGSHAVPHMARMGSVSRVTLIDPDHYEPSNLGSQDIVPRDVGRSKARVQADRLRRIRPDLEVRVFESLVEDVPLGSLRSDVVLTGLDSKRARQVVNERAWRLGVPWIDAGVDGDNGLVRINAYDPGSDQPCLECRWGPQDYDTLEQRLPCFGGGLAPGRATNAPAELGALAAAVMAGECEKILAGENERALLGRQVVMDVRHHQYYTSRLVPNPDCRMPLHGTQRIHGAAPCSLDALLGDLFECNPTGAAPQSAERLEVAGQRFVTRLRCTACGHTRPLIRLQASLRTTPPYRCRKCKGEMVAGGFDIVDRIERMGLPSRSLAAPLSRFGIRRGDILCVDAGDTVRTFEVVAGNGQGNTLHGRA